MRRLHCIPMVLLTLLLAVPLVARPAAGVRSAEARPAAQPVPRHAIRLQRAVFDPLSETPLLPEELKLGAYPGTGRGYYLVQFGAPIQPARKLALQRAGAILHDYVPEFAFIVQMDAAAATRVRALDGVRWVGLFEPAFRLSTDLDIALAADDSAARMRLVVRSFTGEPAGALVAAFRALGGTVEETGRDTGGGTLFKLSLPAASLVELARLSGVAWIEPRAEPILHNQITRSPLIFGQDTVEAELGLYGAGQVVVVGDTGVSTGNVATMHPDLKGHFYQGSWGPGTCASWADYYAHGTHVAGSVLGSGIMDGSDPAAHAYAGSNAGIAPEASLWAWAFCSDWSGLPDTDPYTDYYGVLYSDGPQVRINTNSWGYDAGSGTYNSFSRETDRFIWDHQDLVVVFSAGNDGADADADGVVDDDSMGVPAGAKNILTVGASENLRLVGGYNPGGDCDSYGDCWPYDYPANPLRDDRLSDAPSGMVAFSSRGPMKDGRLKPDVTAPGSNVLSTRHSAGSADPLWGAYNDWYSYCGGTSMAAPLAAGASAIVREFYDQSFGINPSAALVKATLINGAVDMTPGQYRDEVPDSSKDDVIRRPDINQGWGRINLAGSLLYDLPHLLWFEDSAAGLNTGDLYQMPFTVTDDRHPLRITLAWSDYPGIEASYGALVNDLDLEVVAPGGAVYGGNDVFDGLLDGDVDRVNNVEGVDFGAPLAGSYLVRVLGYNVPQGVQRFALVVSGDMGEVGYLEGIVTDSAGGLPLEGVSLRAVTGTVQYRATTDVSGYYTTPLATGTYTVSAWKYGYGLQAIDGVQVLSATVTTQDFNLVQTGIYSLLGCITDQATGAPLAAEVRVLGPFGDLVAQTGVPQATGCFQLELRGGAYTVQAGARLHLDGAATVNLTADSVQDMALAATTSDGLLWGSVTNMATGQPVEGATVGVFPGAVGAVCGADGAYELLLPPGSYTVTVSAPLFSTLVETGVMVPQSNLVQRDYALPTAHVELAPPGGMGVALRQGKRVTRTLTISNTGLGALDLEIRERDWGFDPLRAAPAGAEDVLIVGRYSASAVAQFKSALDALGYSYVEKTEAEFVGTPVSDLLAYGLVIWAGSTGTSGRDAIQNLLVDNANEGHLMAYLDAGGSVLHADNDLGYSRHGSTYYDSYLHAVYGPDDATDSDSSPQLVDGLGLMAPLVVDLTTEPYPDGVMPRDPAAAPLFIAERATDPDYPYVGLAVEGAAYRAMYWAFDLNYVGGAETREELVRRAVDWLIASDLPWLAIDVVTATIPAGEHRGVQLAFDGTVVTQTGVYQGVLRIQTNDPAAQPYLAYPVSMTLEPAPPELAIGLHPAAGDAEIGLPLTYTVVVSNAGGPATGVVVSAPVPSGTTFAWVENGGALIGGRVIWSDLGLPIGGAPLVLGYGVTVTCVPSGTALLNDDYQIRANEWHTPTLGAPVTATAISHGVTAGLGLDALILVNRPAAFHGSSHNATWWRWDFGDGTVSDQAQASHTYLGKPGDCLVAFTAGNLCNQATVSEWVAVEEFAVALEPTASSGSGDPGETVTYALLLTNTGTLSDTFRIAVGRHEWLTQLSGQTFAVGAGDTVPLQVAVSVPAGARGGEKDTVTVSARSLSDPRRPAAADSVALATAANPVYGLGWGPPVTRLSAAPGEVVVYTLRLTNTGNAVDMVDLERIATGWPTLLSTSHMEIAAGGRREVQVTVTVPPGAADGQTDLGTIWATSAGSGESLQAQVVTAAVWHKVYLPLALAGPE